ncbi:MAG: GGDEF domain-containing protein [Wenzhouxiangellaceae bacterium]|nr:GGDEF domain-containing protein [Wenzhouxiangellaceae bacterium]
MMGLFGPQFREQFKARFRDDYQFAMIMLFGGLAVIIISGFTVYRYASGYYLGGTVNLSIVISMLLVLAYAITSGETDRAGRFFAIVTVAACIASTIMFGRTGILWGYVVLWVNFLLTSRRFALLSNLLLITVLIIEIDLFESILEGTTYIVTGLMVTTFAFIFAERLSRYQEQLKTLALQDPLTYAGNRRMMRRDLSAAVSAHRRTGRGATLVLLDIDRFKRINDEHGHEVGDHALHDFADLMRENIRVEDGFYRFGGEEFVLLVPDHDGDEAMEMARSLHRRTSGKLLVDGEAIAYSAGVAVLQLEEDAASWLARADQAMYRAKRQGRNCVILASTKAHPRLASMNKNSRPTEAADS